MHGNRCFALLIVLQLLAGAAAADEPAQATGSGGTVTLKGQIEADGSISALEVAFSEPAGKFDELALKAVRTWRLKGFKSPSSRQTVWFWQTFNFHDESVLKGGSAPEPTLDGDPSGISSGRAPEYMDDLIVEQGAYLYWPREAFAPFRGGWLRVEGEVDPAGRVAKAAVAEAHPPGLFDKTVLKSLGQMRFKPAKDAAAGNRRLSRIYHFDAGYVNRDAMRGVYLVRERARAERLLRELATFCPDVYPRGDDALNRALLAAPRARPLPTGPVPKLSEDAPEAIEQLARYAECLFTSREHLKDPKALIVASRSASFDQTIRNYGENALCERALALGAGPEDCHIWIDLSDEMRVAAKRWLATQYAKGYQQLILQDPRARDAAAPLDEATLKALREAKDARQKGERTRPVTIMTRAIKRAEHPEDLAMLRLTFARMQLDMGDHREARELIDALLKDKLTPWYARQLARVLSFVVYDPTYRAKSDFEQVAADLNRELGVAALLEY